ncbi:DegV family protein [Paenibacillus ferrarius]|uniref:DegV family protein n=1 Tax=Paenibacillus ferrarius TaxID=1469647 RepID=UPI003D293983
MSRVRIFTDSTSDLGAELLGQHEIGVVPLYVVFEDETYQDGVTMHAERLFQRVAETGKLPKTAAPSPADFENAFRAVIEAGDDIVYIGLSSEVSSTYQNAKIAADAFPEGRITVIDSRSLSTGIGMLVLTAAEAAEQGRSAAEIQSIVEGMIPKIDVEFIIDTLEFLHKGGRCSSLQHFIGSLLKIRPVVKVIDGAMTLTDKVRGKREKVLAQLLDNALANKDDMNTSFMFVTHAKAAEEAQYVKQRIEELTGMRKVYVTETGCVISSHCGPQTVGIVYAKK